LRADDAPFAPRLQLFTGKGGVGKSSVVAALGLALARDGKRPLIVELGHRASIESVLQCGKVGYEPSEVSRGVWAMNIDFEPALIDYLAEHVRVRAIGRAIAENRTLRGFFDAAPAVPELVTLNKLRALLEQRAAGALLWDRVLVDLDATGHALMLLELPTALDGMIGSGPLRRLLTSLADLLTDPERTRLHVVTLPGELPVQETLELCHELGRRRVPLGCLVVNQVPALPLSVSSVDLLDVLEARGRSEGRSELIDDIALARRALFRHARARDQIARLQALPLPVVELPRVPAPVLNRDELCDLGARLVGMTRAETARRRPST
jgi:anion-transporting  ArsA/GET3 family ATPase